MFFDSGFDFFQNIEVGFRNLFVEFIEGRIVVAFGSFLLQFLFCKKGLQKNFVGRSRSFPRLKFDGDFQESPLDVVVIFDGESFLHFRVWLRGRSVQGSHQIVNVRIDVSVVLCKIFITKIRITNILRHF